MREKDASVVKEKVEHGDSLFLTRAVLRLCAKGGAPHARNGSAVMESMRKVV